MTESTKHRRAFDRYWRLGEHRSLERLHAALEADGEAPSLRTLSGWSSKYGWQERIADLERAASEADREAQIAELRGMAERHAKEGLLLQQKGAQWLAALTADQVTAPAAIRAITEGVGSSARLAAQTRRSTSRRPYARWPSRRGSTPTRQCATPSGS